MGTYSTSEYMDIFGGLPEPGETYPDDPDAVRDAVEEWTEPCDATLLNGKVCCYRKGHSTEFPHRFVWPDDHINSHI